MTCVVSYVVSLRLPDPVPVELKPLYHDKVAQAVRDLGQTLGTGIVYYEEFYRMRDISNSMIEPSITRILRLPWIES